MTQPSTPTAPPAEPATPENPTAPPGADKGFPEGTPLTEMTEAQQLAYWKHHARRHEDAVKAYKGLTPQEAADMQAELETLKDSKLDADERALKDAVKQAAEQARNETEAKYLPQIQQLQVKSIASQIIQGDRLEAFMRIANPASMLGEDGQVDETAVMGTLTAMYGTTQSQPAGPRWQNFGQHSPPPPPAKPGLGGQAELQKRFGAKT